MEIISKFKSMFGRQEPTGTPPKVNDMKELGVAGAKISSGFVYDEFLPKLLGDQGRRTYREMRDNDATISAILFAVEMTLRAVKWEIEPGGITGDTYTDVDSRVDPGNLSDGIKDSYDAAAFVEGVLFEDMNHTWDDFISNVLSMLTFGWQYSEIVWKRRNGQKPDTSPNASSIFNDGLIGIEKLGDRSQETLDRWDVDEHGKVYGMWQRPPNGGEPDLYIPMAKALLFRPKQFKGSPEGRSVLRGAYRSWYFLTNIQEIESIAIERELNGLPVVYIPNEIVNHGNDPQRMAALQKYVKMVRDVKFNEQGGIVLPSNPYYDDEGKPTNVRQVEFDLVNAGGSRAIDTDKVIKRYQADIARTILADFIMLGQSDKGSFALSKNKTDLFLRAMEGWMDSIASVVNRDLITKLWQVNGLDPSIMPNAKPDKIAPEDIAELGDFIQKIASAGVPITDPESENYLRRTAGLPETAYNQVGSESEFPDDDEGGEQQNGVENESGVE